MIVLFCMVCASWTDLFSHIGIKCCQMTRVTSINDNLINKRGPFGDSQVSTTEANIIVDLDVGGKACMQITHLKDS